MYVKNSCKAKKAKSVSIMNIIIIYNILSPPKFEVYSQLCCCNSQMPVLYDLETTSFLFRL